MTRNSDAGKCSALVDYARPSISDNCAGVLGFRESNYQSKVFPQGTSTETWLALDASFNTATCEFDITVVDAEAPSIACPSSLTQATDAGQCSAVVTLGAVTASDNCAVSSVQLMSAYGNQSIFPLGAQRVQYGVNDTSGLTASCSLNVTIVDQERPTIGSSKGVCVLLAGECLRFVAIAVLVICVFMFGCKGNFDMSYIAYALMI